MTDSKPFSIDIGSLKTRDKKTTQADLKKADNAGEKHGFVDREVKGRRGRPPSPRTGQVHAKVLPNVAQEIGDEARRRGVQQGVVLEEAWAFYKEKNGL